MHLGATLRANISETVLVLLINEQGEKEKGRDEREFSWFCFFWRLGCHGTERRRAWRVEAIEPDRLLRLFAEMNLPGRAWLQFEIEREGSGSLVRQTAIFDPLGIRGLLYWYSVYPLHQFIFTGMLRGIAKAASSPERRYGF